MNNWLLVCIYSLIKKESKICKWDYIKRTTCFLFLGIKMSNMVLYANVYHPNQKITIMENKSLKTITPATKNIAKELNAKWTSKGSTYTTTTRASCIPCNPFYYYYSFYTDFEFELWQENNMMIRSLFLIFLLIHATLAQKPTCSKHSTASQILSPVPAQKWSTLSGW